MKLYTEPRVEIVGYPVMDIEGIQSFLDGHDMEWPSLQNKFDSNMDLGDRDPEWLVEMAGRMCYQSWKKSGGKDSGRDHDDHVKHLIECLHGSTLEHVKFNFAIWGVSRTLAQELTRHRSGCSYSMLSQRYVDSKEVSFSVPPDIQELESIDPVAYDKWVKHMRRSRELYAELEIALKRASESCDNKTEKRKRVRQASRSVLPGSSETKLFFSANARAIRNMIEQRASPAADLEIRNLFVKIFDIMLKRWPLIVHGMTKVTLPDGTSGVESKYRKV